jgi:PLP dependent protein
MDIAKNLLNIESEIPGNVRLVAVSKTRSIFEIMEAYNAGQRIFGENKAQEMISKQPQLPKDIEWHFIGHMQTNKVKFIAPFVAMIESVDRMKALKEINKQAITVKRVIPCLLQFHIAEEDTKFGLDLSEAREILLSDAYKAMQNVRLHGVMGMATFTDDMSQVKREFTSLKNIFQTLKNEFFAGDDLFCELSMGMSGDYPVAIEAGSTIIRVGSHIFGERN